MFYDLNVLRGKEYTSLRLDAANEQMAIKNAKALGYTVFSVKSASEGWVKFFSKHERFPLMLFSQELLALLEAGLNLIEAIDALAEKENRPNVRQTLQSLLRMLSEGQPLSSAMQSFPSAFPPLYIAALKASERTGGMPESLRRYIAYQGQIDEIKKGNFSLHLPRDVTFDW
jgi:general secretion pathway protein F